MNAVHAERNIQYEERIYMKTSSAVTAGHRSLEDGRIYKLAPDRPVCGIILCGFYIFTD